MPHTLSALTFEGGKWIHLNLDGSLGKGSLTISAPSGKPLTIADLRLYNWLLSDAEKAFDATSEIRRNPVADRENKGVLVEINADNLNVGDTLQYIPNNGIRGYFEIENASTPAIVEEIKGKKAIRFDGTNFYRSNFPLPASVRDNVPYTMEAVILNPTMELNECFADFTTSHDELEKIMGVNGTEPRCGVMNHYGWYEDSGWQDLFHVSQDFVSGKDKNAPDPKEIEALARSHEGEWQHIKVDFDGRIEKVYVNGKLISEKDIQLLVKPVQYVTLGRNAENEWPFTGYLHSLRLILP